MLERRCVLSRGHFIMWFKKCRKPRMFRAGMILFFVLTLVMLFANWRERPTSAKQRRHLKDPTSNFHETLVERVEKQSATNLVKDFVGPTPRLPGTTGTVTADSASQASVQDNPTQLSGSGISVPQNESKIHFNSTEVKNMRQHILNSFYNVDHLTFVKSALRIGQRLRYEMPLSHEKLFEVTEDFLKLIPEESPLKGRHFNTCAVVGNSAIVLNSSCGQDIDSNDFVMRCNLPQIEGYERDVGTKANLTTMNPSVIAHNFGQWENDTKDDYDRLLRRLEQVGDQILYVPALRSSGVEKYVRVIIQTVLKHNLPIKTAFPPAPINTLVEAIWKKAGFEIRQPSAGAHMYTLAALICEQIHLYGFYPYSQDTRGRALSYHYYDNTMDLPSNVNGSHNMPEEFRVFQQLHKRGALVLHTEPCQ